MTKPFASRTGQDPEKSGTAASTPERAFLTLNEAAAQIGCTRRFLEFRCADGELKTFRPSRRLVRIQRSEFNRWVESYTSRKGGFGP
ncbi:MAG: excisionase family DNA-binding protein [Opitutaceae bacterium]